ncbi:MAG: helix-turn-helix transcriptional regulator [Chroococcales cyanobacterium]
MAKKPKPHPYADEAAFERLMLLIVTLLKFPGIGCPDLYATRSKGQHHNALETLQQQLIEVADSLGISLPEGYPATPTLRKDLERLRDYSILERRMYRWGYYLGTGVMTKSELKAAFDALESQAKYQGDPQIRQIYQALCQRLRGFEFERNQDFFYPIRQNLNRTVDWTDPYEMMRQGKYKDTLFHQLDTLETAIAEGQAIEIFRTADYYGGSRIGPEILWPLQLVYYNIAWYLLYEKCSDHCFAVGRINRFSNSCKVLTLKGRGVPSQKESLEKAYHLLNNGWGLHLGDREQQQLELEGKLPLERVKVRFSPPVSTFIAEGELRHPKQKLVFGPRDSDTGNPKYLDYLIELPKRSLNEFSIWIQRYGDKAKVLSPPALVEKHRQMALNLVNLYETD